MLFRSGVGVGLGGAGSSISDLIRNGHLKYQPGPDAYEFVEQGFTTTYTRETLEDNPGIIASIKKALGI